MASEGNTDPANEREPSHEHGRLQVSQTDRAQRTELATAGQLTEVGEKMTGFERATLRWAKVAVAMSFLAVIFVCAQWYEMHEGGKDTHTLAQSANTQAAKMDSMSDAATKIQQAADGMFAQEKRLADDTEKSLKASNAESEKVLNASIAASQLDQRAWVSIIGEKLSKEPAANEELSITYTLYNSGKTPALKMEGREGIFVGFFDGPDGEPPIPDWKSVPTQKGAILFPGTVSGVLKETIGASKVTEPIVTAYDTLGSRSAIYLRVHVDYDDVFGRHHWVETCVKHRKGNALDAFDQCATGIGIDQEAKPNQRQ